MIDVKEALKFIFDQLTQCQSFKSATSQVNLPPFRASIKDGYALKSTGGAGIKKVVGYVSAGDPVSDFDIFLARNFHNFSFFVYIDLGPRLGR